MHSAFSRLSFVFLRLFFTATASASEVSGASTSSSFDTVFKENLEENYGLLVGIHAQKSVSDERLYLPKIGYSLAMAVAPIPYHSEIWLTLPFGHESQPEILFGWSASF